MKKIAIVVVVFIGILIAIPLSFQVAYQSKTSDTISTKVQTGSSSGKNKAVNETENVEQIVTVFRESKNEYQEIPLETYLIGVVSGEMPALYDIEALKAQAVAARTYTIQLLESEESIYDTVKQQFYLDDHQLKEKWQGKFDEYYEKVSKAVNETAGEVITYEDELIKPFYFSISNGYTENSEDYWSKPYPYLRSVNSEWDKTAPKYKVETEFTLDQLRTKFNDQTLTKESFIILNKTEGKSVNEILIGDKVYSGRQFRETLGLRSTDFSLSFDGNKVVITTYGYGHGVGMSQYGANELAKQGKTYDEIIKYYYQNVNISEKNS
ncbi:MAG: stage II sporulation protein D [Turicibacter sp.]|nr:stage II sporulation protein D [Turicibacter sp.]